MLHALMQRWLALLKGWHLCCCGSGCGCGCGCLRDTACWCGTPYGRIIRACHPQRPPSVLEPWPLSCSFASFAFAAQSLLSALGVVQFISNIVFGRFVNKEKVCGRGVRCGGMGCIGLWSVFVKRLGIALAASWQACGVLRHVKAPD